MSRSTAGERLATLENEVPHLWQSLNATRQENRDALDAMRAEFAQLRQTVTDLRDTLSRYAQTALMLAGAAVLHATGGPLAHFGGEILQRALKALLT